MSHPHKRPRTVSPSEEEESTDYKLALLSSLHPSIPPSTLLELLLTTNGSVPSTLSLLSSPRPPSSSTQSSLTSFLTTHVSTPPRPKKGTTLHLYSPTHFSSLTPTTLHPSFLPSPLATSLLQELLTEAVTFPPPAKFSLFDRAVSSPHTSCFYLRTASSQQYSYQGATFPETRIFTHHMAAATALVEEKVNALLDASDRKHGMMKGRWSVNAAFVNCYEGGGQSVGWHSDQLTYLGPMAVIASVSLGCAREFRVRRVAGEEDGGEGVYSLWLPHNSLLVMNAGMQEEWKHSIHPAAAVSLHPVAGGTRINITYRCYRESLRPEFTPRCGCGEPAILRCRFKGEEEGGKKYFWSCNMEYKVGGKGCGFFEWGVFDEFGEPVWGKEKGSEREVKVKEGDGVLEGSACEKVDVVDEAEEGVRGEEDKDGLENIGESSIDKQVDRKNGEGNLVGQAVVGEEDEDIAELFKDN